MRCPALGLDIITFNFLYTEQGRRIPDRAAAARGVLSRGDRRGPRGGRLARGGRCSSAASRWAAGSRPRSPPPIPALPVAGLVLLGYPLHPPGQAGPSGATSTCRRSAGRCCSCRAAATRSARPRARAGSSSTLQPAATLHVVAQGDHSFKLPRKDPAAQAAVYAEVQRVIAGLDTFSSMTSPPCEKPWRR